MKQIDECLTRVFNNKYPLLSKKWKAFWGDWIWKDDVKDKEYELLLYHYHHLILVYNVKDNEIIFEWWEKPTDKRGLDNAKKWLHENQDKINEYKRKLV